MKKATKHYSLLLYLFAFLLFSMEAMAQKVRQEAVAGQFYPRSRQELNEEVGKCYAGAKRLASDTLTEVCGRVRAVIVPHAGYVFSGSVAASAFSCLPVDSQYDNIFLIGPSHHVAFDGASVCNAFDAYRTPLGLVPVNKTLCDSIINANDSFSYRPSAHDREHCLEVELPFLQYRLKKMPPIVPIIIGTQSYSRLQDIAKALKPYFNSRNLFVISSDFSHYPSYADALTVDRNSGEGVESGRIDKFVDALQENGTLHVNNLYTSACGQCAIAVLLLMAEDEKTGGLAQGLQMRHIAYLNSGDSPYGDKDQVVGYHSFVLLSDEERGKSEKENTEDGGFALSADDKEQLLNVAWNAISPARFHKEVKPTKVFDTKVGVFVTLTKHGRLRGCIGHFGEDIPLGEVTREMAHAAAFEDPRFTPLREDELKDISIEISVLTPLKRIYDIKDFHYGKDGIYMRKGFRSGTFLPQVADEVNWTKEEFLGHCAQDKAGIGWDGWKTAELYTYEAIRFSR